jgi:hypothetical protein
LAGAKATVQNAQRFLTRVSVIQAFSPWQHVRLCVDSAPRTLTAGDRPFHQWSVPGNPTWAQLYRVDDGIVVSFPELARFKVSNDGHTVALAPRPEVEESACRHLFVNQIVPMALSAQGWPVFHGGAIQVRDAAIAFIGQSGLGKSTLTAHLATLGYPFLTDDGLVLDQAHGECRVLPSSPAIRLWNDSKSALMTGTAVLDEPVAYTNKSRLLSCGELPYCDTPQPLMAAYFLGDGSSESISIESLSQADAFMGWVNNSFLLDIEDQRRLAEHFKQVAELAVMPIAFRLDYPRRYDRLPEVAAAVIAHAARVAAS